MRLIEFKNIKTYFCFLDETGLLYSSRDKFFALGLIKVEKPQNLYNRIRKVRNKYNYREELKWANLDRKIRFQVAKDFFEIFLEEDVKFNSIILNKDELNFQKYYQNNLYRVYRNFTVVLLKLVLGKDPNEIITL